MKMLCVPEGFAHGFQVLEESSEMLYLHTEFYSREHEGGLRYSDSALGIAWPLEATDVSERDRYHSLLSEGFQGAVI
jgi:dTDP-4-dehydrorhamnose 3,5-epimerase